MEENKRTGNDKSSVTTRPSKALIVRDRVDYPRRDHREEYAAEVAPARPAADKTDAQQTDTRGNTAGYAGIALGILAMFMWSIVLGPIAAVLGFYAFVNGKRTLGGWAIGLGLLATISYFAFIPFVR